MASAWRKFSALPARPASGGELAERLGALYDYMAQRLLWANLKNETAPLDEVLTLLGELRDAWTQIRSDQQQVA